MIEPHNNHILVINSSLDIKANSHLGDTTVLIGSLQFCAWTSSVQFRSFTAMWTSLYGSFGFGTGVASESSASCFYCRPM